MELTGEFETHLTVRLDHPTRLEALECWGASRGLKCVHILLHRGVEPSQPMLTRRGTGTLSGELKVARDFARCLDRLGFPVLRIKVEAATCGPGVPQSANEAAREPPDRYFEHHVKLLLSPELETAPLIERAERHAAHLSRNALRQRDDGCVERFVTQRCRSVGRVEARQRLEALLEAIRLLGYPVLSVKEEYVVYDSNAALDAGWIRGDEA
jgi:hypothetical protein